MASTTYGLTEYGFKIPSLDDLVTETKQELIRAFGENFNTQANSVVDKFTTIFNEREYQLILLAASIYASQTMGGAEGIYLDEILSKRGIYRRGKTKGSGVCDLTINNTVPYSMVYSQESYTVADDYVLSADTQVAGNIIAQKITNADWKIGKYTFNILSYLDGNMKSLTQTLSTKEPGDASFTEFMQKIKDFIVENTTLINDDLIQVDSESGTLYIGYNAKYDLVGLNSRVDFRSTPIVGERVVTLEVIAKEAGYSSREAGTATSISPTPSGCISINNRLDFNEGRDVETDMEYKLRAGSTTTNSAKATRPAILAALSNVPGVEKVRIFKNNTNKTNSQGIPAYKFECVVYGGSTEDICETLYDTVGISDNTYGNVYYDVTTGDNQVERVYYIRATSRRLSCRIKYRAKTAFVSTEIDNIKAALINIVSGLQIADTLYNIQLVSAAGSALSSGRFTQLTVEIKNRDEADTAYTTEDITANMTEAFDLDASDITLTQLL